MPLNTYILICMCQNHQVTAIAVICNRQNKPKVTEALSQNINVVENNYYLPMFTYK